MNKITRGKPFTLIIQVDGEGVTYNASGLMTSGSVRILIGCMEQVKYRLLCDLDKGNHLH